MRSTVQTCPSRSTVTGPVRPNSGWRTTPKRAPRSSMVWSPKETGASPARTAPPAPARNTRSRSRSTPSAGSSNTSTVMSSFGRRISPSAINSGTIELTTSVGTAKPIPLSSQRMAVFTPSTVQSTSTSRGRLARISGSILADRPFARQVHRLVGGLNESEPHANAGVPSRSMPTCSHGGG